MYGSIQELAAKGYNNIAVVSASDLVSSTSGGAETVTLFDIPADCLVRSVGYYLKTAFDGASSSALGLEIGDSGDADGWVVSSEIHEDATEVSSVVSDGAYGFNSHVDAASASSVEAVFTPTGDSNSDIDVGEVVIFADIVDLSLVE